jgi:hypothetical protein
MRRIAIKIAKFIFAIALIILGAGMFLHPVASDYFWPGGRYSGPQTAHLPEGKIKVFGVVIGMFGLGLMYSAFYDSRK